MPLQEQLIHGALLRYFEGQLSFSAPRLAFGSPLANQLASVDTGRTGWVPVKLYVDRPDQPGRVVVVVG